MSDDRPEIELPFVAPNFYSIARSRSEPGCVPLAIYEKHQMYGPKMRSLWSFEVGKNLP